ncbi:hypothetical protein OIV19_21545 [Brucella sp. HL-2]|nr:hypothetical protein [Brucella sp. HL-2]MCV9910183.1 hypothetical protein [Brucella sp. HL-2]
MSLAVHTKTPGDVLDYDVAFDDWLLPEDRVDSWAAEISESRAVIDKGDYSNQNVRLWISGGQAGETAHVSLTITTVQERTKTVCFKIRIRECR